MVAGEDAMWRRDDEDGRCLASPEVYSPYDGQAIMSLLNSNMIELHIVLERVLRQTMDLIVA
jgi:hypothetical protein